MQVKIFIKFLKKFIDSSAVVLELHSSTGHVRRLISSGLCSRAAELQYVRPTSQWREERAGCGDPLSSTAQDAATVSD